MGDLTQPLAGVTVVELATGVAGPYAGKLLADHGADVIKVEPPGGDPSRYESPRPGERPDPENSPLFLHLNTNKRSVVADVDAVRTLVEVADVVIESGRPGEHAWLHDVDGLVVVSVTPFGQAGPYASYSGAEIVSYAMGGPMHATGMADREPIKLAGNVVQYQCGGMAATAALAGLALAERDGGSVHVDVSNLRTQAGSIDRRASLLVLRTFTGRVGHREGGHRLSIIPSGIYPTVDGYVQVLAAPNWMDRLVAMLDDDELSRRVADPAWTDDPEFPELLDTALHVWTLQRTKQEATTDAQARRLGVTPVNSTADVLADEHFRQRGFWQPVDHPVVGRYEAPGAPFRMQCGWRLQRPAPTLGQHTDEVLSAPPPVRRRAAVPTGERRLPLDGIRVLDLTVVWAGPYCTMLLGDLGAEVIKVDNAHHFPTASRGAIPRPAPGREVDLGQYWSGFPGGEAGARPWNRVGAFVCHARNKLGATLDLRTGDGHEAFMRLVERSDVLVENNSARVMDRLGLGWDALHERNPRLIVTRMPSLGLEGPYRDYIGFGAHVEALCGLTGLRGYPDLDPTANEGTYHMDPASGTTAAFAVLAALRRRERTGHGEMIEFAQAENLLQHIGEYLVDTSITGETRSTLGNRHPHRAPQGVYPCAGDDRWVAVSVADDAAWAGLRRAMGGPAWAADRRYDTEDGRRTHHDEIDAHLARWTAGLDRHDVFARCQAEGVAAGPVLDDADCYADPQLRAEGFFAVNSSADVPPHELPGHLWRWDGPDMAWGPLSRLGADNEYVMKEVAGLSGDEYGALERAGHFSLDYLDADGRPL